MVNSFERLYDGLWARREADHDDCSSSRTGALSSASPTPNPSPGPKHVDRGRGIKSCKYAGGAVLRGTNRGTQWSVAAEVTHLQRRVADLAAELQVHPLFVCSHIMCVLACTRNHHATLLEGMHFCSVRRSGPHLWHLMLMEESLINVVAALADEIVWTGLLCACRISKR